MKCPICKKAVKLGDPDFPFCSERCRTTDLGNWASEKYAVHEPVQFSQEDDDEEE
jgi:endogenous inhibitor of DNA gyrase (YacG/DUF329 family)